MHKNLARKNLACFWASDELVFRGNATTPTPSLVNKSGYCSSLVSTAPPGGPANAGSSAAKQERSRPANLKLRNMPRLTCRYTLDWN